MGFTIFYRDHASDEDVLRYGFERDIFFLGVPEYRPHREDTIIDVGAHIGTFSLLAAHGSGYYNWYKLRSVLDGQRSL